MKSLFLLSALGLLSLSSCSIPASNTGAVGSSVRDGYFFSGSARGGGPMHWQKRSRLGFGRSSAVENDSVLTELTAEDIANIKAMRKKSN